MTKTKTQHELDGTFRNDRHGNTLETEPYKQRPKTPEYFGDEAAKEWKRISSIMVQQQILTPSDIKMLELYCMQFDIIIQSYADIQKKGTMVKGSAGTLVVNPAFRVLKECTEIINKISAKFGFSPVDRMKIKVSPKEEDALGKLLKQFEN